MAARRPSLRAPSNPFGVSNSAFGAFDLGGGKDPAREALEDASELRYTIGLRYNNGTATNEEYLAAIAAEMAAARVLAGSADEDTAQTGRRRVAELENLTFDINDRTAEAQARAGGDASLLAYYEGRIGSMAPGTPAQISMQEAIKSLRERIANQAEVDSSRKASYDLALARNRYENGEISDDDWVAALRVYAAAQKPDTTAKLEADQTVKQWEHSIGRGRLVFAIKQGEAEWDDLLDFDRKHMEGMRPGTEAHRDAVAAYQNTQAHVYNELEKNAGRTGVLDKYQAGQATAAATLTWYQNLAADGRFSDNPDLQEAIAGRIYELKGAVQDENDHRTLSAYNDGDIAPADFMAYAKSRAADFAPGTADHQKWTGNYEMARDTLVDNKLERRWRLSQEIVQLQVFIAQNSGPLSGGTTTSRRLVLGADGEWRYVENTAESKPSVSEQEAFAQRQAEVAQARTRLAGLTTELSGAGGFISSQQRLDYLVTKQADVAPSSPKWFAYQQQIEGMRERVAYEGFLTSSEGIRIGFSDRTAAGAAATRGDNAVAAGGGTGARPGTTRPASGGAPATATGSPSPAPTGRAAPAAPRATTGKASFEYAASLFLNEIGVADTVENRAAIVTWMRHESGSRIIGNNPLNLHVGKGQPQRYVNESDPNVGVFSTLESGVAANARNLLNAGGAADSYGYRRAIAALREGGPAAFFDAIARSSWAESRYGAKNGTNNLYNTYRSLYGSEPPTSPGTALAPPPAGAAPGATRPIADRSGITVDAFLRSIRNRESGGDYKAKNSSTGAFGAYQFRTADWTRFAGQYLGDPGAIPTPENQDKVARALATDIYRQTGSWESVAHWWMVGGMASAHIDQTRWGTVDRAYVYDVIRGAGGRLTPSPATPFSVPAGQGVASPLLAERGATVDPNTGIRQPRVEPLDFPVNMDANAFSGIYSQVVGAALSGELVTSYTDGMGNRMSIALPDSPEAHADLVAAMDEANLRMLEANVRDHAGINGAGIGSDGYARAAAQFDTAFRQAGTNQLTLMELNYGGVHGSGGPTGRTTTPTGLVDVTGLQRGERAQPRLNRIDETVVAAPASQLSAAAQGELRGGRFFDSSSTGGLQYDSLNPLAAGARVLGYTTRYINTQTAIARAAIDGGDFKVGTIAIRNAIDASREGSALTQQIGLYSEQAQTRARDTVNRYGLQGTDVPEFVAADLAKLQGAGQTIGEALEPAQKLYSEKILPFVVEARPGVPRFEPDGAPMLKPGVVWLADENAAGKIVLSPKKLPVTGVGGQRDEPNRVDAWVPGFDGRPKAAKAEWTLGDVGYLRVPNTNDLGQPDGTYTSVPIKGRVLQLGDGYFENPLAPQHWTPEAMEFTVPASSLADANFRIEPAVVDASGTPDPTKQGIAWSKGGFEYRIGYDETTGAMIVYQLEPVKDARGNATGTFKGLPLTSTKGMEAIRAAGLHLDPARNSQQSLAWLLAPDLSGPDGRGPKLVGGFVGFDYDYVRDFVYGPQARKTGAQVASTATALLQQFGRDPWSVISDTLRGANARGARSVQNDIMAAGMSPGFGGRQLPPTSMEWLGAVGNPNLRAVTYGGRTYMGTPAQAEQWLASQQVGAASLDIREVHRPPAFVPPPTALRPVNPVTIGAGAGVGPLPATPRAPLMSPAPTRQGDVMAAGATLPSRSASASATVKPTTTVGAGAAAKGTPAGNASSSATIRPIAPLPKAPVRPPAPPKPAPMAPSRTDTPDARIPPKPKPKPVTKILPGGRVAL